MQTNLAAHGDRFDSMVETIVLSPQFRNRRTPATLQQPTTQLASRKVNDHVSTQPISCASHLPPRRTARSWLHRGAALSRIVARIGRCPRRPAFPKRFGVVFLGCGINEDHWSAEGQGAAMKLSKTLSPLEPLKEKDQCD